MINIHIDDLPFMKSNRRATIGRRNGIVQYARNVLRAAVRCLIRDSETGPGSAVPAIFGVHPCYSTPYTVHAELALTR